MILIHPQTAAIAESAWEHISLFIGGATALGIIAHAVNTFPTPKSDLGKWALGTIQYIVGQRLQAAQTKEKTNAAGGGGN